MANKNYLIYPNPDFTPRVDSMPDGTLVAYDAETQLWATFDTGLIFKKAADGGWSQQHLCGCTPIVPTPNRHSQYPLLWLNGTTVTVHSIVARAWIGHIPEGWEVDHIDGNIRHAAVINLRILPAWLNHRDGGFIKKLRNKKIDPGASSRQTGERPCPLRLEGLSDIAWRNMLLRYFDRMANFKRTHSLTQYARLTHDDLLRMLVTPEFSINNLTV